MSSYQENSPSSSQALELGFDREGFPNQRYGEIRVRITGEILSDPALAGRVANFATLTVIQNINPNVEPLTFLAEQKDQFVSGYCLRGTGSDVKASSDAKSLALTAVNLLAAYTIQEGIVQPFQIRVTLPAAEDALSKLEVPKGYIFQPVFLTGSGGLLAGLEFSDFDLRFLLPERTNELGPFNALYFRTQFDDILAVFSPHSPYGELRGKVVDAFETRRRMNLASYILNEQDFIDGRVTIGAPFVLKDTFQTSAVKEIVVVKSEPHYGRKVAQVHISQIKEEFERMIGL